MKLLNNMLRRLLSTEKSLGFSISRKDEQVMRRIEIQRKALIVHQQQAYKDGLIEPMIHVIEKIQDAMKKGLKTPAEKLEEGLMLEASDSYAQFMAKYNQKFGDFAMELYGSDTNMKALSIAAKGELVPYRVKDEVAMVHYRKYFIANYNLPGGVESVNPNKFLRLKPVEEFSYLPIIPISPTTLKRFKEELLRKRAQGYKFRIDKGNVYSFGLTTVAFAVFLTLIYLLYRNEEESWVLFERNKRRKENRSYYYS